MTRLHRMNLKGPWDYEWLDGPHPTSEAVSNSDVASNNEFLLAHSRVRMPSSIQDAWGDVTGRVRFQRRFQKPTNLEEHERVHIAFDGLGGQAAVSLNDEPLIKMNDLSEPHTIDVTDRIGQSNAISVELTWNAAECSSEKGGLWKPVAIEIHQASPAE